MATPFVLRICHTMNPTVPVIIDTRPEFLVAFVTTRPRPYAANGPALFVKFANLEFKQLLSIAQAKQKYSKTVADRN